MEIKIIEVMLVIEMYLNATESLLEDDGLGHLVEVGALLEQDGDLDLEPVVLPGAHELLGVDGLDGGVAVLDQRVGDLGGLGGHGANGLDLHAALLLDHDLGVEDGLPEGHPVGEPVDVGVEGVLLGGFLGGLGLLGFG